MTKVICPYCQNEAKLVDGTNLYPHRPDLSELKFWKCEPCRAYVGCHRPNVGYGDGTVPLGRLANASLRALKMQAHATVDNHWRYGGWTRREVYSRLAEALNLLESETHIGEFDEDLCEKTILIAEDSKLWKRSK